MTITSRDNDLVKEWRRLCADGRFRRRTGRFAMEGARLCADAVRSGVEPETVLYTPGAALAYPEAVTQLLAAAPRAAEIPPELAQYMADTATPQGVFCIAKILDNRLSLDTIKSMGRYVALEDLQDPGNLGTVIRTAEAFGIDGLILTSRCCDTYSPKVLRGSMGGVFRLPLLTVDSLPDTVAQLQQQGLTGCACVVSGEAQPVHTAGLGAGCVCLIGNEGNGLCPETVDACHKRVTIVMAGRAESLNASMAAGIVMWELTRPK